MPKTRSQTKPQERAAYLEAGMEVQTALRITIRWLKVRQVLTGDPDETRLIMVQLLEQEAELAKVQADLVAFLSEQRAIEPPTVSEVEQIKMVARELDRLTTAAATTRAIVDTTTALLDRWQVTRASA